MAEMLSTLLQQSRHPLEGEITVETEGRLVGKGTNGVGTNGVTADLMFFDRGTFWVLPLTYFCLPKSARAHIFPQSVKIHYFCSGLFSVDPICPQPTKIQRGTEVYTRRRTLHS